MRELQEIEKNVKYESCRLFNYPLTIFLSDLKLIISLSSIMGNPQVTQQLPLNSRHLENKREMSNVGDNSEGLRLGA